MNPPQISSPSPTELKALVALWTRRAQWKFSEAKLEPDPIRHPTPATTAAKPNGGRR